MGAQPYTRHKRVLAKRTRSWSCTEEPTTGMCRSKPAGTHTEEEKRIQGSPKPTNTNKNLQSHAKGKPTYKATQNTRPANASTAQQKTLKIGNGDETRAFPNFSFKPKQRQQQQQHLQPVRNPSANPNKHHSSRIDCVPCSSPCEIAASR
jgi:hypothetical protein